MQQNQVTIVTMSDTHDEHYKICVSQLPPGDIFIHAGDFTSFSEAGELQRFRQFLTELPYKHKIVIAGNHDFALDEKTYEGLLRERHHKNKPLNSQEEIRKLKEVCTYLQNQMIEVQGIRIYGTPVSAQFVYLNWGFTYKPNEAKKIMKSIPQDIDVLITHGPPYGILDKTNFFKRAGCKELAKTVKQIKPQVHIFGHIHEGYGWVEQDGIRYYNAASKRFYLKTLNPPHIIKVTKRSLKSREQLTHN